MTVIHDARKVNDNKWILVVQSNGTKKELCIDFPVDAISQVGWSDNDDLGWLENKNEIVS
jgi:hypothetical protein